MAETPVQKQSLANRLYTGQISYDFIKHRRTWLIISVVMIALSILVVLVRGLSLGIEFRGGTDFQVAMPITATTVDEVRSHAAELSVAELDPQVFWQIHRSTLVRADAIDTVRRDEAGKLHLTLRGCPDQLAVSRLYAHLFKAL